MLFLQQRSDLSLGIACRATYIFATRTQPHNCAKGCRWPLCLGPSHQAMLRYHAPSQLDPRRARLPLAASALHHSTSSRCHTYSLSLTPGLRGCHQHARTRPRCRTPLYSFTPGVRGCHTNVILVIFPASRSHTYVAMQSASPPSGSPVMISLRREEGRQGNREYDVGQCQLRLFRKVAPIDRWHS